MAKKIAYLGPPGTFAEEAALVFDKTARLVPFPSIRAVANAVALSVANVDEGVVPIENSIEGSVTDTLDLLIHESGVMIKCELVLPIRHNMVAKPGININDVKVLYSIPQALGQCRDFVALHFPKVPVVAALSTAAAVEEMMASSQPAAAIGTARAAEIYGATILASGIQDKASNETRFVILAKEDHAPTGHDKTSLCFAFSGDRPGVPPCPSALCTCRRRPGNAPRRSRLPRLRRLVSEQAPAPLRMAQDLWIGRAGRRRVGPSRRTRP